MSSQSLVEPGSIPRIVGVLVALTLVAWVVMSSTHDMAPSRVDVLLAWVAMTIGMMTPSAVPMIVTYVRVAERMDAVVSSSAAVAVFAAAYLAIWVLFALAAVELQSAMQVLLLVDEHMRFTSPVVSGAFLIAAGVYQLTPLKHVCITKCRSPLGFLLSHYRPGYLGALIVGLRHGTYCIGCCWLLMLLVWVGGMMNVAWMAILNLVVIAEKTMPGAEPLVKAAGVALCCLGVSLVILSGSDLRLTLDTLISLCHR